MTKIPKILVLGAGFGGLSFCQSFPKPLADITVIDRQNHHLFQPLLYQVATAGLTGADIAQPFRSILRDYQHISVRMDEIEKIELETKQVTTKRSKFDYDYLVLALGGQTAYFGHPEWEKYAMGLKSLAEALEIRKGILTAFELAENSNDSLEQAELLTVVVVGGGATGVELAGAFAELSAVVLKSDFRRINTTKARIILIESGPRLLAHLPEDLSLSAAAQLKALGVEVLLDARVENITENRVELANQVIHARNIIWAAGIVASPLTNSFAVEKDRGGRLKVNPDLSLPGHPEVFVVGDLAYILDKNGKPVPGVSPAAIQMAKHVAKIIQQEITGKTKPTIRPAFKYWDKGTMATIGRSAAVAQIKGWHFSGFPAWVAWLLVHLVFLIGFKNKLSVFLSWTYSYFTYKRGARIISNSGE